MILSNQVRCLKCGDEPYSAHRHNFVECKCGNIAVDGGMDYLRRVGDVYSDTVEEMSIEMDNDIFEAFKEHIEKYRQTLSPGLFTIKMLMFLHDQGFHDRSTESTNCFHECVESVVWCNETKRNTLGVACAITRTIRDNTR